jgi:hypothetical protein
MTRAAMFTPAVVTDADLDLYRRLWRAGKAVLRAKA